MKKMKLSAKAVLSLVLSAVLFCMPGLGFAMNGNYAVSVHAEVQSRKAALRKTEPRMTQSRKRKVVLKKTARKRIRYPVVR